MSKTSDKNQIDEALRLIEELARTLDLDNAIKNLNLTSDDAALILKDLAKRLEGTPQPKHTEAPKAHRHGSAWTLCVDGASRGNPGLAGAGAAIKDPSGNVVKRLKKFLGSVTNNAAEYNALIMGLEAARSMGIDDISVKADSELMVKQVNGLYRVKSEDLRPLYDRAMTSLKGFKTFKIEHVYREHNKEADALANEAIDSHFLKDR
ncbi:MAG: ribonuclease HI family protein [Deltaproteobacteria bacterium]|nr:ribonuclease HI family protein [Deltaproteobacteria bacterium]